MSLEPGLYHSKYFTTKVILVNVGPANGNIANVGPANGIRF